MYLFDFLNSLLPLDTSEIPELTPKVINELRRSVVGVRYSFCSVVVGNKLCNLVINSHEFAALLEPITDTHAMLDYGFIGQFATCIPIHTDAFEKEEKRRIPDNVVAVFSHEKFTHGDTFWTDVSGPRIGLVRICKVNVD